MPGANKFRTNQNFPPSLMPRELGWWHRPARWETGSNRWSVWARSLIERHGLVVLHHSAPAMIVLHHLPLLHLLHERWGGSSRQYYPRVHLSVQAILQQTVGREQQRYLPSLPHAGSRIERPLTAHFASESRPVESQAPSSSGEVGGAILAVQAPLSLVLQRMHHVDEFTHLHRRTRLTVESMHTLAQQVVRQTQRVEGQMTGAVAFITRQAARTVADQAASAAVPTAGSAASLPALSSPSTPTWTPHTGQTAAVNIEQLTDQVMRQMDRRMTAWRERRGRI